MGSGPQEEEVDTSDLKSPVSLEEARQDIKELYDYKGWDKDLRALSFRAFVEYGEFIQSWMKKQAGEPNPATGQPYTEAEIAEEFVDFLHFGFEALNVATPNVDLDVVFRDKVARNWREKKKGTDTNGNVVKV